VRLRDRVEFSAIVDRAPLRLPGGARVAVWPLVTVEVWDPEGPMPRTVLPPPQGSSFIPDVPNWSWAEYGVRVGFWRMKAALDARGLKATLSLNGSVIEHYPRICEAALEAGWEFMGHNIVQKPMPAMADEESAIAETVAVIEKFTGKKPRGWMGPGLTETARTPELLVRAGIEYTADWVLDDQPVVIKTDAGPLYGLPYSVEINDVVLNGGGEAPVIGAARARADHLRALPGRGARPGPRAAARGAPLHPRRAAWHRLIRTLPRRSRRQARRRLHDRGRDPRLV
jgi:allantoinase